MSAEKKEVEGQLLDGESVLIDKATVEITLVKPTDPNALLIYKVSLVTDGYHPEVDGKVHVLKLREDLMGDVFLSISGLPSRLRTKFNVNLQDSVWNNLEWFENL